MFELLSVFVVFAALFAGSAVRRPARMRLGLAISFLLYALACYAWQETHGAPGISDPEFLREAGFLFLCAVFIFLLFVYEHHVHKKRCGT